MHTSKSHREIACNIQGKVTIGSIVSPPFKVKFSSLNLRAVPSRTASLDEVAETKSAIFRRHECGLQDCGGEIEWENMKMFLTT